MQESGLTPRQVSLRTRGSAALACPTYRSRRVGGVGVIEVPLALCASRHSNTQGVGTFSVTTRLKKQNLGCYGEHHFNH